MTARNLLTSSKYLAHSRWELGERSCNYQKTSLLPALNQSILPWRAPSTGIQLDIWYSFHDRYTQLATNLHHFCVSKSWMCHACQLKAVKMWWVCLDLTECGDNALIMGLLFTMLSALCTLKIFWFPCTAYQTELIPMSLLRYGLHKFLLLQAGVILVTTKLTDFNWVIGILPPVSMSQKVSFMSWLKSFCH